MKREQDSQQGNGKDGEQDMEPDRERDKEHEQNKEQHKEQDTEQYKQQEKQEGTEQDGEEKKRDRRTDKKQDGEGDEEADEQRYHHHQQQQQQIEDEDEGQKERTGNDETATVADGDVKRSAAESLISRLPAARLWHRQYDSDQQTIVSTRRTQFLTSHFGCTAHCPAQQVLAIDVRSRSIQTDASQIRPLQSRELFNYCIVYRLIV